MTGTDGDDVVVTHGARRVRTYGGDDLVCVTGSPAQLVVDVAEGDDVVDTTDAARAVTTRLGTGADRLIGGPRADAVTDNEGYVYDDDAPDVISTGGGDDAVITADRGAPDRDLVSLGAGDDTLTFDGGRGRTRFRGGEGADTLILEPDYAVHAPLVVNNRHQRAMTQGDVVVRWASFERFDLTFTRARKVTFRGTAQDETVIVVGRERTQFDISTAGGHDLAKLSLRASGHVDLGAGSDEIALFGNGGPLVLDLSRRSARYVNRHGHLRFLRILGVEDAGAGGWPRVTLIGDAGSNQLRVNAGCRSVIRGGPGDDRMGRRGPATICDDDQGPASTMRGGPGDDIMRGGQQDDLLIGGSGTDRADGRIGTDTCRTEARRNCEAS
ncbi:Hemolysin-type calcium-binding region [Nocardioides sp. PD653]|nr:Hemolysin-type calcium-binding region [Nocardioides sp. PD653-B2]GAW55635.1 Hemolysin-type calcium-binding region [Nocardioides sp. PD653]